MRTVFCEQWLESQRLRLQLPSRAPHQIDVSVDLLGGLFAVLASQFAMRSLSSNETVLGWSSCAAPTDHCAASHNETRPRATQEFPATGLNTSFFLFHFISSNASVWRCYQLTRKT